MQGKSGLDGSSVNEASKAVMDKTGAGEDCGQHGGEAGKADLPAVDSRTLFAGSSSLRIRHGDETYSLRLTRKNRLILTK